VDATHRGHDAKGTRRTADATHRGHDAPTFDESGYVSLTGRLYHASRWIRLLMAPVIGDTNRDAGGNRRTDPSGERRTGYTPGPHAPPTESQRHRRSMSVEVS